MLRELGFYKGVNLGGWMSQCDYSPERLDGFITPADFALIADWASTTCASPSTTT